MDDAGLDNPFRSALDTIHAGLAIRSGDVVRYPADVAPFIGVAGPGEQVDPGLEPLVPEGDTVLFLGCAPAVGDGWTLEPFRPLAQMTCERAIEGLDGPDIVPLGEGHRRDVLALTALQLAARIPL